MQLTWKEKARIVITKVIEENPNATKIELRDLANEAYPFGARENYPYKMWLQVMKDFGLSRGSTKPVPQEIKNWWIKS